MKELREAQKQLMTYIVRPGRVRVRTANKRSVHASIRAHDRRDQGAPLYRQSVRMRRRLS